jgi:hypothetical protein
LAGSGGTGGYSGAAGTGIVDGGIAGCPCTRRPGIGTALTCPAGIDESSFATIGPAGGKIDLIGREGGEFGGGVPARLTVPPKAFDKDVAVTLVETSVPPPTAYVDWSPIYQLSPSGTTSASRMTLQLPWSNGPGIAPVALTIYFAVDASGPFAPLPEVYPNAGFTSAAITEFGFFFVGAPKTASQMACP